VGVTPRDAPSQDHFASLGGFDRGLCGQAIEDPGRLVASAVRTSHLRHDARLCRPSDSSLAPSPAFRDDPPSHIWTSRTGGA
jgi:hypothetical protein